MLPEVCVKEGSQLDSDVLVTNNVSECGECAGVTTKRCRFSSGEQGEYD